MNVKHNLAHEMQAKSFPIVKLKNAEELLKYDWYM